MSREKGEPYVNLCLAVLGEAKKAHQCLMWQSFKRVYRTMSLNQDALGIAEWVTGFWAEYFKHEGKLFICPHCKIKTYAKIKLCDICYTKLEEVKL